MQGDERNANNVPEDRAVFMPANGGTGRVFCQEDLVKASGPEARVGFCPREEAPEMFRHVLCSGEAAAVKIVTPAERNYPAFSVNTVKFEFAERKLLNVPEEIGLLLAAQKLRLISEAFRNGIGYEEVEYLPVACHRWSLCQ